jgi:hypothetical protein
MAAMQAVDPDEPDSYFQIAGERIACCLVFDPEYPAHAAPKVSMDALIHSGITPARPWDRADTAHTAYAEPSVPYTPLPHMPSASWLIRKYRRTSSSLGTGYTSLSSRFVPPSIPLFSLRRPLFSHDIYTANHL